MNKYVRVKNIKTGEIKNCKVINLSSDHIIDVISLQEPYLSTDDMKRKLYSPVTKKELDYYFSHDNTIAIGVVDDNRLIAFGFSLLSGKDYDHVSKFLEEKQKVLKKIYVANNYVDEEYRGSQLQQKMIKLMFESVSGRNIEAAFATVHPENVASLKSIKQLGFEVIRRAEVHGEGYDRFILMRYGAI